MTQMSITLVLIKSNQLKAKCVQKFCLQLNNWLNVYSIKKKDLLNGRRVESKTDIESKSESVKYNRKCIVCRNHGIDVRIKGHKNECIHRECNCDKCLLSLK
jgi:hypothetical protein